MFPYLIYIALAFLTDRLSKQWAAAYLAEHGTTALNPYLTLRETYNTGIAYGLLEGVGPLVGWLTTGVIIVLFVYLIRLPRQLWLMRFGLALIIGGALGNQVDRIVLGHVLDFIETPLRIWGVFNMADVMINVGMIVALVGASLKQEPNPQEETGQ